MLPSPLRVRYQTIEFGSTDIHVCTLRDNQQFSDPDGAAEALGISDASWPLFGIVWPSGMVLANHMMTYQTKGKRILEIGCGIGISSLLLNERLDDITATDYHPEVEGFLNRNTSLNNGKPIAFQRIDWAADNNSLGRFDIIIGSDLLYEDQHVKLLADFIRNHANENCAVVIVDPGRGRKAKFSKQMTAHGFASNQSKPVHTDYLQQPFKGYILEYTRAQVIAAQ